MGGRVMEIEKENINDENEFQDDDIEEVKRTPDDVSYELDNAINEIKKYVELMDIKDPNSVKRTYNFLSWINKKTNLIREENALKIPKNIMPNTVNSYLYDKFDEPKRQIINKYYDKKVIADNKFEYVIDKSKDMNDEDIKELASLLVIKRTAVVWIEFGFNVGKEFGGKHPALILKYVGDNIIVAPLSSKKPKEIKGFHVRVNNVMKFNKKKTRWINIHRILPVSINRIDFNSAIGSVRGEVLDDISEAIKNYGVR